MIVSLFFLELISLGIIAFAFLITELQPDNKKHDEWLSFGVPIALVLGFALMTISATQKAYGWLF